MYSRSNSRPSVLPLAAALLLCGAGPAAVAVAPAPARGPAADARSATVTQELRTGRVSSFDARRGLLVVDGAAFHVDPLRTAFSDDRRKPAEGGMSALRVGDRVTVRGVRSNGVLQAAQVVVHP